jgi:hypothetical protein
MRTHEQIITGAGGPAALARVLGVDPGTAKQWKRNKSLPSKHWKAIVAAGLASWEELGTDAALRGGASLSPTQGAAA